MVKPPCLPQEYLSNLEWVAVALAILGTAGLGATLNSGDSAGGGSDKAGQREGPSWLVLVRLAVALVVFCKRGVWLRVLGAVHGLVAVVSSTCIAHGGVQ